MKKEPIDAKQSVEVYSVAAETGATYSVEEEGQVRLEEEQN